VAFAYALVREPVQGAAGLTLVAGAAAVLLLSRDIATVRIVAVVAALCLLLPLTALVGPVAAFPSFPQLFVFRVTLIALAGFGLLAVLMGHGRWQLRPQVWYAALPLVLWVGWSIVTLLWAPDPATGLQYLLVLATMLAVVVATATAGTSRRRMQAFGITMIIGYAFVVGVTVLEYTTGFRMPTSRMVTVITSQTYAVTSVFHNQNDLATYLAICWPFLLGAVFFTRRLRWLVLALLFAALGAIAFVRSGSRSSLIAAGLATIVLLVVLGRSGAWLRSPRARGLAAVLAVVLLAGVGYLLFNDSESPMLRQFRLEGLISNLTANEGSGQIRVGLLDRGLELAGSSALLGHGPGQAEALVIAETQGIGIGNLHNWWLEVYANGGLPGLGLQLVFCVALVIGLLGRVRDTDPFVRYLASAAVAALVGLSVGALGPSSSMSFAPMWILFGLGLAILTLPTGAQAGELLASPAAVVSEPATGDRQPAP
jgi:O-antigen ligase